MKNLVFLITACLLILSFSCSSDEQISAQNSKVLELNFETDNDFKMLMKKAVLNMKRYQSVLSKLPKEEIQGNLELVNSLLNKKNLRKAEVENLSRLLGFNSYLEMEQDKDEFLILNSKVHQKFPNLKVMTNTKIAREKIKNSIYVSFQESDEPGPGNNEPGGSDPNNCNGIYQACLGVAFTAGGLCIISTGGIGSYACVLAAAAAMEYCRQQRIGCH